MKFCHGDVEKKLNHKQNFDSVYESSEFKHDMYM